MHRVTTQPGQTLTLTLFIEGIPYIVNLKNLMNSSDPHRAPRIQVRYHHNDPIALKFREVYAATYAEMLSEKEHVGPRVYHSVKESDGFVRRIGGIPAVCFQ